jgi:hypothetical protein
LVALMFILVSTKPSQAGISDCFKAATGSEVFREAYKQAAELAQCGSQAAADPVMDAAMAIMIGLRVGGVFSDTDQCLGLIDSTVGKMVAKALRESGLLDSIRQVLGDGAANALRDFAEGRGKQSFSDLVDEIPALQLLLQYLTCGCVVAGAADEAKQLAEKYLKSVKECGETIEKIVEDVGAWCENTGRQIVNVLGDAAREAWNFVEGVVDCVTDLGGCLFGSDDNCAPNRPLPAHLWGQPLPRSKFVPQIPAVFWDLPRYGFGGYSQICGAFYCSGGHVITKKLPDGTIVDICSRCPREGEYRVGNLCLPCQQGLTRSVSADGMCSLTHTTTLKADGSACKARLTSSSCCAQGQRVAMRDRCEPSVRNFCVNQTVPDGPTRVAIWGRCEAVCRPPQIFDIATGRCADCEGNTIPLYDADPAINSRGRCEQCPPDLTRELSTAAPTSFAAPNIRAAGVCKPCPPGQIIWNFSRPDARRKFEQVTRAAPPGADAASPMPPTHRPASGAAPAPAGPKSPAQRATPAPPSPDTGPPGPTVAASPVPGGPILATEPGKCVPCPRNWIPVYHSDPTKSSFGHCERCPPGTSTDLSPASMVGAAALAPQCRPLNCPGGLDPKNPHACRPTYQTAPVIPGDRPAAQPGAVVVPAVPGAAPCPPGTRLVGGTCVAVPQPPTQTLRPTPCPPGMIPNPRGPGCISSGPPGAMRPAPPPSAARPPAQTPKTPQAGTPAAPPPRCPPGTRLVDFQCVR